MCNYQQTNLRLIRDFNYKRRSIDVYSNKHFSGVFFTFFTEDVAQIYWIINYFLLPINGTEKIYFCHQMLEAVFFLLT